MKYRVMLTIRYYNIYFDFDNIAEAGAFAKTVLISHVKSEDAESIKASIEIINPSKEESEDN